MDFNKAATGTERISSQEHLAGILAKTRAWGTEALRANTIFVLLVLGYAIASFVIAGWSGTAFPENTLSYLLFFIKICACCLLVFFCMDTIRILIIQRPGRPFLSLRRTWTVKYRFWQKAFHAIPVLIFIPVFFAAFTSFKTVLPTLNPFFFDRIFADIDRAIHFGTHPWESLQPFLGTHPATYLIDLLYYVWVFVMFAILFWQSASLRDLRLRTRFFLAFCLTWIVLGTGGAILLSSAGPCYFERVTGLAGPYQPLMDFLQEVDESFPVLALTVQDLLWQRYQSGEIAIGSGITAMPSMHVANATLFALLGWNTHRALGVALTIYALAILLGSVHLGWHYAIDGYVAIFGTCLLWRMSGAVLDKIPSASNPASGMAPPVRMRAK